MSERYLEVVEPRQSHAPYWGSRSSDYKNLALKMHDMGRRDHLAPPGSIVGVVWAGDPEAEPAVEETQLETLLDEFQVRRDDVFLRVRGSSMTEAGIEEGDLIQVRLTRPGDWPQDGAIVWVEVNISQAIGEATGQTTIKKFFRDGQRVRLQPANATMKSQFYGHEDIRVLGIVTRVIRQSSPL